MKVTINGSNRTSRSFERVNARTDMPMSLVKVMPESTYRDLLSEAEEVHREVKLTDGPTSLNAAHTRSFRSF